MKTYAFITLIDKSQLKLTRTFWDRQNSSRNKNYFHYGKNLIMIPTNNIYKIEYIK